MPTSEEISREMENRKQRIVKKITDARVGEVNKLIKNTLPGWKCWVMQKLPWLAKALGYYSVIVPKKLFEKDIVREEIQLWRRGKVISKAEFNVRDGRQENENRN